MNKQPVITEQTRLNFMEAFWSIYKRKRIEKISIKEITAKAGYNRGTFYEYFRDVYDILDRIEIHSLPTLNELPPLDGLESASVEFIGSFMKIYQDKFKYYDILLGENGDPSFQRKLKDSIKSLFPVKAAKNNNMNGTEIDYLMEYILSGMIGVLSYSLKQKSKMSAEKIMLLVYGLMQGDMSAKLKRLMG